MNRILPLVVFLLTGAVGLAMTVTVYYSVLAAEESRFEAVADEAADRISEQVNLHIALLVATRSLFAANSGPMPRGVYREYIGGLGLDGRYEGIEGIGFARLVPTNDADALENEILRNYDLKVKIYPETDQQFRTPIVLLEPYDTSNKSALGYDMMSEKVRREAMVRAIASDLPQASGPVELVTTVDHANQTGFLVYLSLKKSRKPGEAPDNELMNDVRGFVYAPFRAADLHKAALRRFPEIPVVVETYDVVGDERKFLYRSEGFGQVAGENDPSTSRTLEIAGRSWALSIHARPEFRSRISFLNVYLLGAISLVLAAALSASTRSQLKSLEAAHQLHAVSKKMISEKELMLQEMKHRIKNSLARVLAIARQTANNASSVDDFSNSFSARLQAMASAQDVLTRSGWYKADLRELLENELDQVFDNSANKGRLDGPPVELDEKATQALGLTFHELATNSMKYGAMSLDDGQLSVNWKLKTVSDASLLVIDWVERMKTGTQEPTNRGFGTRLIDANIEGELNGQIRRHYGPDGMSVRIEVPLSHIV